MFQVGCRGKKSGSANEVYITPVMRPIRGVFTRGAWPEGPVWKSGQVEGLTRRLARCSAFMGPTSNLEGAEGDKPTVLCR